jgi:enamine deaminase RidA (YjgF/YER057c/UK114 family)
VPWTPPVHLNPASVAAPIGKFSHLSRAAEGSELLFVAGQIGADPAGAVAAGAYDQTRLAFENIERLLAEVGASPRGLVKLFTLVAGTEHLPGFYAARDEVFVRWFPNGVYPTHSLAVVAALALPELAVEIEGVAAVEVAA